MRNYKMAGLVLWAGGLLACGGGGASTPAKSDDAGAGADSAVAADMANAASPDLASAILVMNGCTADQYVDQTAGTASDRMIMVTNGGQFDNPCMTILAHQGVEFMWKFSSYPIAPGVAPSHKGDPAGASPSPIMMHNTGSLYTVSFHSPGFYPFYVPMHDDVMLGVIQVQ